MPDVYVLYTNQPGAIGGSEENVYGPDADPAQLESIGHALGDGATPPLRFVVLPLQPAKFDSL